MLNFLAAEDHHTLNRQSALLQGRSPTRHRPLPSSSSSTISSSANRQRRRQRQPHSSSFQSTSSATSVPPLQGASSATSFFNDAATQSHLPEGFFPDLGLSWRDPRRRGGRDYLRRARLKKEVKEHKKLLNVMRNVVYEPKKKNLHDPWDDPTIKHRAMDWYTKEQAAIARGESLQSEAKKEVNWFVQMEQDRKEPTPRKKYIPPPPKPPPGPHHPRMLVPVPAVAAEPVAHVASSKKVMYAVACREHYYKLFERTMLMSRAKGVQYLGGPTKLMKEYFVLFGHLLRQAIEVCRAIEEWRYQLSLITDGTVPYHKRAKASIRPAFMWGGETVSSKGHKKRYYKNYILKMIEDLQVLIKAEIPAKLGKGHEVLIKKARVAGDYVKGIEVCPLLLPFTLDELVNKNVVTNPTNQSGLPSEYWYGCSKEDVIFVAKMMQEERSHVDVQGQLFVNPESLDILQEEVARTSSFGPSMRASVESMGTVQLRVAKDLQTRSNSHMSVTFK